MRGRLSFQLPTEDLQPTVQVADVTQYPYADVPEYWGKAFTASVTAGSGTMMYQLRNAPNSGLVISLDSVGSDVQLWGQWLRRGSTVDFTTPLGESQATNLPPSSGSEFFGNEARVEWRAAPAAVPWPPTDGQPLFLVLRPPTSAMLVVSTRVVLWPGDTVTFYAPQGAGGVEAHICASGRLWTIAAP